MLIYVLNLFRKGFKMKKEILFILGKMGAPETMELEQKLKILFKNKNIDDHFISRTGNRCIDVSQTVLKKLERGLKGQLGYVCSLQYNNVAIVSIAYENDEYRKITFNQNIELPETLLNEEAYERLQTEIRYKQRCEQYKEEILKHYNQSLSRLTTWFGLTKNNLKEDWTLRQIIAHGLEADNRTRAACVSLGWLTQDGKLKDTAPDVVKQEASSILNKKF